MLNDTSRTFFLWSIKKSRQCDILIFSKVRIADVITPALSHDRSDWQKLFNGISSKHFDFVLCDADNIAVICVIELNDKSHQRQLRKHRDDFVRSACASAGVNLIEVPAKKGYVPKELAVMLSSVINSSSATMEATPHCIKCGASLVTRVATRGRRKGLPFLACTAFPACRYTENITG
jgi:hypothetical protein